jgi:hypothetical protein
MTNEVFDHLLSLISIIDQGERAIKWCNDCAELIPTILAISGSDFRFIGEIIPKCKYLKHS